MERMGKKRQIKTAERNILSLAEEYTASFDRSTTNNLIESAISDKAYVPGDLHKKLLSLKWMDVFTTNYDTLLERTSDVVFRENNYRIIKSPKDLPGSTRPRIIKLHGSIPDCKPYIITEEDYRKYPHTHSAFVNTVQQAMLETRLCLIGFSGDDPNFLNWLGWLRDNMEEDCPKIYLIGLFDTLSATEKALMTNRSITVIDISGLTADQSPDGHYKALQQFINMLSEMQRDEDCYPLRPFKNISAFWKPDNHEQYKNVMLEFSNRLFLQVCSFVILPVKQQRNMGYYFDLHFRVILSIDGLNNDSALVACIIRMLRRCNIVLTDDHARKLEDLLDGVFRKKRVSSEMCKDAIEIALYLLEMYRIDGDWEKFETLFRNVENLQSINDQHNELLIEKCKYYISRLEFRQAADIISKLKAVHFVQSVKKAGLLKQIRQEAEADAILTRCSQDLAQMRISEELYDSYIGYLNFCYRLGNVEIEEQFSDLKRVNELYNTRRIIMEMRDELVKEYFDEDEKADYVNRQPVFLNTIRREEHVYNTRSSYKETFRYLLAVDKLCLPVFYEQKKLLPRIIREIDDSSPYKSWRISLAIRSNDSRTMEMFLSRELLGTTNQEEIRRLFEGIMVDAFSPEGMGVISRNTAIKNSAMLVLFLEDQCIVNYLRKTISSVHEDEHLAVAELKTAIQRLSIRFNKSIATALVDVIFGKVSEKYSLASYFNGITIDFSDVNVETMYKTALNHLKSQSVPERDNAVGQLLLLWKHARDNRFEREIADGIWEKKTDTLPKTALYLPVMWEQLPSLPDVNYSELYKRWINEYGLIKAVGKDGYNGNNSYGSVDNLFRVCYTVSEVSPTRNRKIDYDQAIISSILNKIEAFFENEKALLDNNVGFLLGASNAESKFEIVAQHIALIIVITYCNGNYSAVKEKCSSLYQAMKEKGIRVSPIHMVKSAIDGNLGTGLASFINSLRDSETKSYRGLFFGLHCLLFLEEKRQLMSAQSVRSAMEQIFQYIKYGEIKRVKAIWAHITGIFEREYIHGEGWSTLIEDLYSATVDNYIQKAQAGNRDYTDALYNCVDALKRYTGQLKENRVQWSDQMSDLIEKMKKTEIPEVDSVWERDVL